MNKRKAVSPINKELAQTLVQGAELCFANADALHAEASALGNVRAWARGLVLHQISLEECAKVEMIAAAVTSLLMGEAIDVERLYRAMRRHDVKNKANAYFLPKSAQEQEARQKGDVAGSVAAFKEVQEDFHESSNDEKNDALYVNPGDPFRSPLATYTEDDFVRVRTRNEEFLSLTYSKVRMLAAWSKDWDQAAAQLREVQDAIGLDSIDRNNARSVANLESTLMERLQALVEAAKKRQG